MCVRDGVLVHIPYGLALVVRGPSLCELELCDINDADLEGWGLLSRSSVSERSIRTCASPRFQATAVAGDSPTFMPPCSLLPDEMRWRRRVAAHRRNLGTRPRPARPACTSEPPPASVWPEWAYQLPHRGRRAIPGQFAGRGKWVRTSRGRVGGHHAQFSPTKS
jgi:hypothetical protein